MGAFDAKGPFEPVVSPSKAEFCSLGIVASVTVTVHDTILDDGTVEGYYRESDRRARLVVFISVVDVELSHSEVLRSLVVRVVWIAGFS
jgi:hypothetical protein